MTAMTAVVLRRCRSQSNRRTLKSFDTMWVFSRICLGKLVGFIRQANFGAKSTNNEYAVLPKQCIWKTLSYIATSNTCVISKNTADVPVNICKCLLNERGGATLTSTGVCTRSNVHFDINTVWPNKHFIA